MLPDSRQWPFPPYEKIRDRLTDWFVDDEAAYRVASRAEWIATEKIHGANFCSYQMD